MQNFEDIGVGYTIESAIFQDLLDFAALFNRTALESVNHGHGDFAFAEVARYRFAEHIFRGGQIQNIIDYLKSITITPPKSRSRNSLCA